MRPDQDKAVQAYLKEIQDALNRGNAGEHTHRPALKTLIQSLRPGIVATNEPTRVECGAPDFVVSLEKDNFTIGHIEAKDVGTALDEVERSEQLKRYKRYLGNLVLTDYLEFRWFVDGTRRGVMRLAALGTDQKLVKTRLQGQLFDSLLMDFLSQKPRDVNSPKELAERMARLTHVIRDIIIEAFSRDKASATLRDLRQVFAKTLVPELALPEKVGKFADMYAQTIAYGLFAAAYSHYSHGTPGRFVRLGAAREIPKTNPLLRKLFDTMTGSELDAEPYVGFVDDLVRLLDHTDMNAVMAQFGKRKKREDPVVHFYETYLATYDPKLRQSCGVYFTPLEVVSYIVRSVDILLKKRFGLAQGLADRTMIEYAKNVVVNGTPAEVKRKAPKVLVLDPACGTGTFLYAAADLIRDWFIAGKNAGMWSGFVREHLLPRLIGFEFLMAPYAVAHLKLGMQLAALDMEPSLRKDWAYDFCGDERLNVYLTNTLLEADKRIETIFGPYRVIADEATAAAEVKRFMPILVVMGNPPYKGHSANKGKWIRDLVEDYYSIDDRPLKERNSKWLQDDYVKFIRWGQWRISNTGSGILAFITNNGYLDNPTFRGMRQQLLNTFSEIYVLDLHGSSKKKEKAPDGTSDQNVFDIQQGVAIGIFVKEEGKTGPAVVRHAELRGTRRTKYDRLLEQDVKKTQWATLKPQKPLYLFMPQDVKLLSEYDAYWKITDALPLNVLGFQTHRDDFAIDFERDALMKRMGELRETHRNDEELRSAYGLVDSSGWQLASAKAQLRKDDDWKRHLVGCLYRPFDRRYCYYDTVAVDRPRRELLDHVAGKSNLCMNVVRQTKMDSWQHAVISDCPAPAVYVELKDGSNVFPLYQYPPTEVPKTKQGKLPYDESWPRDSLGRVPNLNPEFVKKIEQKLALQFTPCGPGDLERTFGPEDVLHYIYAIFHAPTYRKRYVAFLKVDFPRVPLTSDMKSFRRLCALGGELVGLHLLGSISERDFITRFPESGDNRVADGYPVHIPKGERIPRTGKVSSTNRVYINDKQYFDGVPPEVWEFFVGGYQPCEKWLKDRRGRELSFDDLNHYKKTVVALTETQRLMAEIDQAIPKWPIE